MAVHHGCGGRTVRWSRLIVAWAGIADKLGNHVVGKHVVGKHVAINSAVIDRA